MNAKGRDVLLNAYLASQISGTVRHLRFENPGPRTATDGRGGFCTIGLLLKSVGCTHLTYTEDMMQNEEAKAAHTKCQMAVMRRYEISTEEWLGILADDPKLDWLGIAAKYCPTQKAATHGEEGQEEAEGQA